MLTRGHLRHCFA